MRSRLCVLAAALSVVGCASYTGDGRSIRPEVLRAEPGWVLVEDMELLEQAADYDCGLAALAMVVAHYDRGAAEPLIASLGQDGDQRASAVELRDRARALGFRAFVVEGSAQDIVFELKRGRPMVAGMVKPTINGGVAHYEVVIGIHPTTKRVATLDPALGWRQTSLGGFLQEWRGSGNVLLVVMPGEPRDAPHETVAGR